MQTRHRSPISRRTSCDDLSFGACLGAIAVALVLSALWTAADDPPSNGPVAAAVTARPDTGAVPATRVGGAARLPSELPAGTLAAQREAEAAGAGHAGRRPQTPA